MTAPMTAPTPERLAVMLRRSIVELLARLDRDYTAAEIAERTEAATDALSRHPDDAPRHSNRELREAQREAFENGWHDYAKKPLLAPARDARYPLLPPAPRPWGPEIKLSEGDRYRANGDVWQYWSEGNLVGAVAGWRDLPRHCWPTIRTPADFEAVRQAWLAAGGTFDAEPSR